MREHLTVFLSSFSLVAISEFGDKTQLLAFSLAARFRRTWPIIAGITVATLLSHAMAAFLGSTIANWISPFALALSLGITFIAFGLWALIPERAPTPLPFSEFGPFVTATLLFFLGEMGDKTQFATVALAAQYQSPIGVLLGTSAGMILVDGAAVFLGVKLAGRIPLNFLRKFSALLFFGFGLVSLVRAAFLVRSFP